MMGDGSNKDSRGNTEVAIQDQFSKIIDLFFHIHLGNVTLASDVDIDDTTCTLEAGHGASVGECLCLKEGVRFFQSVIVNVNVNVITLNIPFDYAYTTAATASRTARDMSVNGSITTQIFHVKPGISGGERTRWDITRIIFVIEDDVSMDTAKFGGIGALAKGVVLRKKDGDYHNIFFIRSNGEFAERTFDVSYDDKAPAGLYAFRSRRTFAGQSKNGVTIRLDSATDDELELLIQDDLTLLNSFRCIVQGHIVED